MPQVDFYNLPTSSLDECLLFACRLINKVWQQGLTTYILCKDEQQRQQLNLLLWQFKADSFIPHDLLEENKKSPVILGREGLDHSAINFSLLINLTFAIPAHHQKFERIVELVVSDPALKENARKNYRFYADKQYKVQYHSIPAL